MNSRERIRYTTSFNEPDKVPAHLNATKWVVEKLKKRIGVSSDKDLLKALHIDVYDTRGIDLHSGTAPDYIGPENAFFTPEWGGNIFSFWRMHEYENQTAAGWTIDIEPPPLAKATSINELEKYLWPENEWFDYSNLRQKLEKWSEFSIMASGGSIFQHATFLRGMDTLMTDMLIEPDIANYILDKFTEFYYEYYRRMFESTGDLIDIFALADDFGMQNTLLIGPEQFDEYIAPRLKKMADLAHHYNIRLLLHTCGNIEAIIPRFIESGVDILDPIQPECMNPAEIKRKFGKNICLRGGISVQNVITHGTVDDVITETRKILNAMKPGGGYILSPGHPVLQDDIPVENIIAMYKTGYEYGFYR